MIDLEELERLAKAATQLPWEVDDCNNIRIAPKGRPIVATIHDYEDYLPRMSDAAYIVAACNAVPELIAENRALQKRVQELEKQRKWLAQKHANACIDAACDACTSHIGDCPICPLPQGTGLCIEVSEVTFINAAEEAAKEAGE